MALTTREEAQEPLRTYEARSLGEAVELARRFKDEGRYDWFRGQVEPWPPHSSLFRRFIKPDPSEHDDAIRRRDWLMDWVRKTPELSYTLNSHGLYEFLAIAQHYGIPTNLIDFTTDPGVAGFFAADATAPPLNGTSCIYCLNTHNLEKIWAKVKAKRNRAGAHIEKIRIDVGNLWRLQAQRGVFLHANYGWEIDYPMDRILFPYGGYPVAPRRSEIYPTDKSPLEILLDQQFARENFLWAAHAVGQFVNQSGPGSKIHLIPTSLSGSNEGVFKDGKRPSHIRSWGANSLADWHAGTVEDYYETVVGHVRALELRDERSPEALRLHVRLEVEQILRGEPDLRAKAVTWDVRGLPDSTPVLQNALRLMWNGMRRLPYTNAEIAECAASVVVLVASGFCDRAWGTKQRRVFTDCFGEPFVAGFAYDDGSSANGYVSRAALLEGLRPDMNDLFSDTYRDRILGDLKELFLIVDDPRIMFEFPFLREQFVRELIPSQVATERSLTIFNPAKLTMFGNP